jgi:hypothetical protein
MSSVQQNVIKHKVGLLMSMTPAVLRASLFDEAAA